MTENDLVLWLQLLVNFSSCATMCKDRKELVSEAVHTLRSGFPDASITAFELRGDAIFPMDHGKKRINGMAQDLDMVRDLMSKEGRSRRVQPIISVPDERAVAFVGSDDKSRTTLALVLRGVPVRSDNQVLAFFTGIAEVLGNGLSRLHAENAALERDVKHRWLIEHTTDAVWRFDTDSPIPADAPEDEQVDAIFNEGYLADCNDGMARMYGFSSSKDLIGRRLNDLMPRGELKNEEYVRAFVRSGHFIRNAESVEFDHDGNIRYMLNNLIGLKENGYLISSWGTSQDITERRLAEEARYASEERLRLAVEAAECGTWDWHPQTGELICSERCSQMLGIPIHSVSAKLNLMPTIHPADRILLEDALHHASNPAGDGFFHVECRLTNPKGEITRWVTAQGRGSFANGKIVRFLGVVFDFTERKKAEEQRQLLLAELNHRVKNTLATVLSIAQQTFKGGGNQYDFANRIHALSHAHNLLTEGHWRGANLRDLVLQVVAPYGGQGSERIQISGPNLWLQPRAALTLSMAVHELATNAARHGAFSVPEGRIELGWELVEREETPAVHFKWQEVGGPTVLPPTRRGFGSMLIETGLSYELDGVATLSFQSTGVTCDINFPLKASPN